MKNETNRGSVNQFKQINLTLTKTNEKLDMLVDLLAKMIKYNIEIHNNSQ